ncbi:hypothetical protein [Roseibium sp. RKSG952]|uniref:hypothetical protein n=1 Tax=Roseibium sp. RKSG952 TaxID=2529384 RepID=UPI0012BC61E5|nr:hypothetical protein [Roseibium sp. RKSG952]MTH95941.1 hypothetical protein [Roseibium sp. RKSG952]
MQSESTEIHEECCRGPRVTSLLEHFEAVSSGQKQVPLKKVLADQRFLDQSDTLNKYHNLFQKNLGAMYKHYIASVPYMLEEQCRMGVALAQFNEKFSHGPALFGTFYESCSADGPNARTLAEFTRGKIRTLTDSPNPSNATNFHSLCSHNYSKFNLGLFADITPAYIASRPELSEFQNGFDFIHENTTFQFFSKKRKEYVGYMCPLLKEDGLFFFTEKLMQADHRHYMDREHAKDKYFKSRYFTDQMIAAKKEDFLRTMEACQVTLEELVEGISYHFETIYMVWNSGNFYELAASNNKDRLEAYVGSLVAPFVPDCLRFDEPMVRRLK